MDDLKNAIVHEEVLARKFMPATMTLFQRLEKQDEDTGAFLTKNLIDFATETSSSLKQNLKTKTQEKLPPRLNIKSINIAVRCFGHEIRHFTYQNTGKDLANLRYSCPDLLKKIGEVTRRSKKTLSETASFFNLSLPGEISKTSGLLTEGGDLDLSSLREHLLQCRPGPQTELPTSEEISEAVVNNLQVNNVCSGSTSNKIGTNGNASLNSTVSVSSYPWQVERITDHDLTRFLDPLDDLHREDKILNDGSVCQVDETNEEWKEFMKSNNLHVWRKPISKDGLHLYKILGTFHDISAASFYKTQNHLSGHLLKFSAKPLSSGKLYLDGQTDIQYRFSWDRYAIKMDVIDRDPHGESEILHWITRCPYPMKNREYVFLRRAKVFQDEKCAVIFSKSTSHPDAPEDDKTVRVGKYASQMVIKSHNEFEEVRMMGNFGLNGGILTGKNL